MTTIHIKPPYAPQCEITLADANQRLQKGELSPESMAWAPGMPDWVPLRAFPGIVAPTPPPLPNTAQPALQPTPSLEKPKKKISIKAIISLILVILGFMMMVGGTGFGIITFLAGIILGWFASRDFKKKPEEVGGRGVLTAVRVLIMIFCLMIGIGLLTLIVPSCNSAVEKAKHSSSNSSASDKPKQSESESSKLITGKALPYTLTVPPGWSVQFNKGEFDVALSKKNVFFAIIAEDAPFGTPEDVAQFVRGNISDELQGVELNENHAIKIDGYKWILFTSEGVVENVPVAYMHCVTSTSEQTYQMMGWTTAGLFEKNADEIYSIMKSFTFPKQ